MFRMLRGKFGFFRGEYNDDIEQGLPLLEDQSIEPESQFYDLLDVSEDEFIQITPRPIQKSFLDQDIKSCISILTTAQHTIQQETTRRVKRQFYQTLLFAFNVTAVIASPVLMYELMAAYAKKFKIGFLADINDDERKLATRFNEIDHDFKVLSANRTNISNKINGLTNQWTAVNEDNENCNHWKGNGLKSLIPDFIFFQNTCILRSLKITHPVEYCNELANQLCDLQIAKNGISGEIRQLHNEEISITNNLKWLKSSVRVANESWPIRFLTFAGEYFYPVTFLSVSAIALLLMIYYPFSYYDSHREYKDDINNLNRVITNMRNVADASRIINLTSRLGVKLADLTVDKLIERLEAEAVEIEYRWKCRMAFLGGIVKPEASNYVFLNVDGSRDVTKLIFEMADLQPVKNDVRGLVA